MCQIGCVGKDYINILLGKRLSGHELKPGDIGLKLVFSNQLVKKYKDIVEMRIVGRAALAALCAWQLLLRQERLSI